MNLLKEPYLVFNPITEQLVDLAPYFNTIEGEFDGSFKFAEREMDELIKNLSCNPEYAADDINTLANVLFTLYGFREMVTDVEVNIDEREAA
jgi:hypothetical protein